MASLGTGAYVHSGLGVELSGDGIFSHSCNEYISFIDRRPIVLKTLWPKINGQPFTNNRQSFINVEPFLTNSFESIESSQMFQLTREFIEQSHLPTNTELTQVFENLTYPLNLYQRERFNDFNVDLNFFSYGISGTPSYEQFYKEHFDKTQ